ncbi:MAG: hypothetical protein HRF42_07145 [Candidatus Brocadia sp.]
MAPECGMMRSQAPRATVPFGSEIFWLERQSLESGLDLAQIERSNQAIGSGRDLISTNIHHTYRYITNPDSRTLIRR